MKQKFKVSQKSILKDLEVTGKIFANSLILALLIVFPVLGLFNFIILDELAALTIITRALVVVLSYFVLKLSERKGWSPIPVLILSFVLASAAIGFEFMWVSPKNEIYLFMQAAGLVVLFNSVALWNVRTALFSYVLGLSVIALFYSIKMDATVQGFLSQGGSFLLMCLVLPLSLPAARYAASRNSVRKNLQLKQVLVELKNRNVELSKTKEALERYEKEGSNRLRIGVHDLNNRISSLQYLTELIQMKFQGNKEIQVYINKLDAVVGEIKVFTENVLSPPDRNQGEKGVRMNMLSISLVPLVQSVLENMEIEASKKDISINSVLPSDEVLVKADSTYLTAAIRNLLRYAIKFSTPQNTLMVSLKEEGEQLHLQIIDNNRGVTPSTLEHLFAKLPEGYSEFDEKQTETEGIGLASAKYLIEKMNAEIDYQTSINEGLTFIITFNKA